MKLLATLLTTAVVITTIAGAGYFHLWPQRTCHSLSPFGPNDSVCVWSIERSTGG